MQRQLQQKNCAQQFMNENNCSTESLLPFGDLLGFLPLAIDSRAVMNAKKESLSLMKMIF